jgi:hypothetical protein
MILSGQIAGFTQGPIVPVSGEPEFPERFVVMQVDVSRTLVMRDERLVDRDSVYIPVPQGPVDAETSEPVYSVKAFERAIPSGTKVVVLAKPAVPDLARLNRGLPIGAEFTSTGIQGLFLDDCGEMIGGFDDVPGTQGWSRLKTIEQLEAGVERLA